MGDRPDTPSRAVSSRWDLDGVMMRKAACEASEHAGKHAREMCGMADRLE